MGLAVSAYTERILAPDGLELFTRLWRPRGARASIVVVHGAADHSGRWEHVGDYLGDAGFEVHMYDLRGHGRSAGHPMYVGHFDELLDDLELVLGRARAGRLPTAIYGHSFGGLVAATYGVERRPQPDGYVLSAPALGSTTPRVLRAVAYVLGGVFPKLAAPTVFKKEQLSRDPAVGDAYFADSRVHTKSTLRLGKEAFRVMPETTKRLASLTQPTLVIHGEDDTLVPARFSEPFARLPNVERKVFAGLRHELHNEPERDDVLRHVAAWLDAQVALPA